MSEWRRARIADIASQDAHALATGPFGSAISANNFVEEGVPVIRGSNLSLDVGVRLNDNGLAFLTEAKASEFKRSIARRGDLVFTCWGTVGQIGLIDDRATYSEYVVSNKQMKLTPDPARVDSTFLYYLLSSPEKVGVVTGQAIGAAVPGFNLGQLKAIEIALPPLDVQRRIASVLDNIDNLIENNRRRVEVLEEMARTIYREWFVNFRYPGHEDVPLVDSALGQIPSGWTAGTIGDALELKYGKALKADARRGGDVAVVSSAGVVGWHNESFVDGPAIVVGRKGNVGSVHWVDGASWPIDTAYYVASDLPLRFVFEQLRRTEFSNTHAAVPGLSREGAYARPFVIPSGDVLDAFEATVDPLGVAASALATQSDNLASLRDLLLPKLVTGQIDVSALDLNPLTEGQVA